AKLFPALRRADTTLSRRYRQLYRIWKTEGASALSERFLRATAQSLAPPPVLPVRHNDVIAADLSHPFSPKVPEIVAGKPLIANWVTTPPAPGSGGHTTMFRIIRYLESHGYHNRIYFYDIYRADHDYYKSIVEDYYGFHGFVANVDQGMSDAHIVVATGW